MRIQSSAYLAHLSKIREIGNFRIPPTFSNTCISYLDQLGKIIITYRLSSRPR